MLAGLTSGVEARGLLSDASDELGGSRTHAGRKPVGALCDLAYPYKVPNSPMTLE